MRTVQRSVQIFDWSTTARIAVTRRWSTFRAICSSISLEKSSRLIAIHSEAPPSTSASLDAPHRVRSGCQDATWQPSEPGGRASSCLGDGGRRMAPRFSR